MIITRKNLENFLDLQKITNQQIIDELTKIGLEAEINQDFRSIDQQLIVVKIIEKKRHPNSDKNWICKAQLTNEEFFDIVCGADNFEINDKVVLARINTKLKNWKKKIKKVNFYGIISQGMFCAWEEINIKNYFNQPKDGIIVLPKEAKINTHPLSYFFLDDVLFNVSSPWDRKEFESSYVLARYLKKKLNIQWKEKEILLQNNQNINFVKNKNNNICSFLLNRQILTKTTPLMIKSSLFISEKKVTNNFIEDLITYINLLFKTTFKIEKIENGQILLLNKNNKLSFLDKKGLQHLIKIFKKYNLEIKINIFTDFKEEEKTEITLPLSYINKKIGFNLTIEEIIAIFKNSDFQLFEKQKQQEIIFVIPNYLKIAKNQKQSLLGEIIRFYDQEKIEPKPLIINSETINFKNNISWNEMEQKISNYLLNLGINKTQNFVLQKNYDPRIESINKKKYLNRKIRTPTFEKNLKCKKKNKKIRLLEETFDQLSEKTQKYQENYFTIIPSFLKISNFLIEEKNLEICLQKEWLHNQFENQKITSGSLFISKIIDNIFKLFNLSTKNLDSLLFKNYINNEQIQNFVEYKEKRMNQNIEQKNISIEDIDENFNFFCFQKFIYDRTLKNENFFLLPKEKPALEISLIKNNQKNEIHEDFFNQKKWLEISKISEFFQFLKYKEGNKYQKFFAVKLNLNAIFRLLKKQEQVKTIQKKEKNYCFFDFTFKDRSLNNWFLFNINNNNQKKSIIDQKQTICNKKIHFLEILSTIDKKIKNVEFINRFNRKIDKTDQMIQLWSFRLFFQKNENFNYQETLQRLTIKIEEFKKKYNLE